MTKSYDGPGTQAYWDRRRAAFGLIELIDRNLQTLTVEDEESYWPALLAARDNPTVLEILRAQGRDNILFPALGELSKLPEPPAPFSGPPPTDPDELAEWEWNRRRYQEEYLDAGYFDSHIVSRQVTEDGIVRIDVREVNDVEGYSFRQAAYLNGRLHDMNGKPAVQQECRHYILSEGHLDEVFSESYQHGAWLSRVDNIDAVISRWTDSQRLAFGAAVAA